MTGDPITTIDVFTAAVLAAICFTAAIVGAMSGFGSGLIISSAVAPIVGVKAVVPLVSMVMIIMNASRIWTYLPSLDLRSSTIILITSIPTSLLGAYVYVRLDPTFIALIMGIVLILSPLAVRLLRRGSWTVGPRSLAIGGAVFGFLTSNVIGAGLLLIPILLGAGLVGRAVIATDAAIALGTSVFKIAAFGTFGALSVGLAIAGIFMGLCSIPGTWVGAKIIDHTNVRIHAAIIDAGLVVAGIGFLWQATIGF